LELTQSNAVATQALDALPDGVWSIDANGVISYANPAICKMLHCEPKQIVGRRALDFVFEEDSHLAKKLFEQREEAGPRYLDFRLRAADGTAVWTHSKSSLMQDENGQFIGAVSVVQETLPADQAEALGARLSAIVDSSDDAIISKSLDGVIRSWNRGAERIFGYRADEIIGQPMMTLIPDDRKHEEFGILDRLRRGERIDHFHTIRIRKDGSPVAVSVTVSPVRDSSGAIVGASKVARDIGIQKHAEHLQARLAAIVESSDDAIVSKNLDGIIQSWNRGAERIFGYTAEEIIGKSMLTIIPEDRKHEEVGILDTLRRGERIDHFETVRCRKDGTLIDVSVTISPLRDSTGLITGASKVARDITELKRAYQSAHEQLEGKVRERTVDLERANKELEGFTYSVSHDLRGPLRSIVASGMILQEDFAENLPPDAVAELDKQAKAAKRMATLIDDLLKLSRLGRQELRKTQLDMSAIASDLSAEITQGPCPVTFDIQEGMKGYGDSATIRLVLSNLMENACKFSPEGGKVLIGKEKDAFFVSDRGIGFDQQYEDKLFQAFERLVLDRDYPGTGIGLANVKRIIERHRGHVWARSEGPGKGATFYFTLPDGE
jgi:PAS domain S-box-containing protein